MFKRKLVLMIAVLGTVIISGCSKQQLNYERIEPTKKIEMTERPAGKYGVFAEGGTIVNGTGSRAENGLPGSSAPVIDYPGGQLVGCGWYATKERPRIYANPNPGYEVEYCYGAETQSKDSRQYDYAVKGNGIEVPIENDDVIFKVKFRPSTEDLDLTIRQTEGGSAWSNRDRYINSDFYLGVQPKPGYYFREWEIISGDCRIDDVQDGSALLTLGKTNAVISPIFEPYIDKYIDVYVYPERVDPAGRYYYKVKQNPTWPIVSLHVEESFKVVTDAGGYSNYENGGEYDLELRSNYKNIVLKLINGTDVWGANPNTNDESITRYETSVITGIRISDYQYRDEVEINGLNLAREEDFRRANIAPVKFQNKMVKVRFIIVNN